MAQPYSMPWVDAHVARSIGLWHRCTARHLPPAPQYDASEQRRREKAYDEGVEAVERELKTVPRRRGERPGARERGASEQVLVHGAAGVRGAAGAGVEERIIAAFGRFATMALGLEDDAVRLITHEFLPVGTGLARWARRFDPGLQKADIVQACRNAWTACGLQPILGRPTKLTPSILGYSLIYPYTDNFIDREDIGSEAKSRFSKRFRKRLWGATLPPGDEYEATLWTLVGLIEEEYPRQLYPQVFESLLAIHSAQEQSIRQLNGNCRDGDVLEISCAKGGTSVLADAFLARGRLSDAERRFSFDWGVLLQLGDDLQDLRDDMRRGSATLFTRAVRNGERLDGLVTRLLEFSGEVAREMDCLPHATPTLRALLRMSWRSLIVESVAGIHEYFSSGFLRELELCSPFRFRFLRERHERLTQRKGLYASLFDTLIETSHDENHSLPLPRPRCAPFLATSSNSRERGHRTSEKCLRETD
jgi:hypothetical protein